MRTRDVSIKQTDGKWWEPGCAWPAPAWRAGPPTPGSPAAGSPRPWALRGAEIKRPREARGPLRSARESGPGAGATPPDGDPGSRRPEFRGLGKGTHCEDRPDPARRLTKRWAPAARPREGASLSSLKAIAPPSPPAQGPEGTRSHRGPLSRPARLRYVTARVPARRLSETSRRVAAQARRVGPGLSAAVPSRVFLHLGPRPPPPPPAPVSQSQSVRSAKTVAAGTAGRAGARGERRAELGARPPGRRGDGPTRVPVREGVPEVRSPACPKQGWVPPDLRWGYNPVMSEMHLTRPTCWSEGPPEARSEASAPSGAALVAHAPDGSVPNTGTGAAWPGRDPSSKPSFC